MNRFAVVLCAVAVVVAPLAAQAPPWQPSTAGAPPAFATPVGLTPEGTVLYLARATRGGVTSLGWLDPRTMRATMLDAAGASPASTYDVYTGGGRWMEVANGIIPANAISAGTGPGNQPVPVLRVLSAGWLIPAIWSAEEKAAIAMVGDERVLFSTFEALVPDWAPARDAAAVGQALRAAKDSDGTALVPFRAPQGKGLHVGKYRVASSQGYVPYGGKEVAVASATGEVFVGTGVWRAVTGRIGNGAIPAGFDDDGSPLFILRARQGSGEALGKYNGRTGDAYVPYGGAEVRVTSFEVLYYDFAGVKPSQRLSTAVVQAEGANLLVNPGAETQPVTANGWRQLTGDWSKTKPGTESKSGQAFFWGGQSARAEMVQDIPLAALQPQLAGGQASAIFRGWLGSWKDDGDSSQVFLEALSANGTVLKSATTGTRNYDTWTQDTLTLPLPAQTTTLRLRLVATRAAGNDNNGYFDDLEVRLVGVEGPAQATAQAPATLADRGNKVTPIRTYFGYYSDFETLSLTATDDIRGGTYADTYSYQATAGEPLNVAVRVIYSEEYQRTSGGTWEKELSPQLTVTAPDGKVLPVVQNLESATLQTTTIAGAYAIRVAAANPANLGRYQLSVMGLGQEVRGKLDPARDTRADGVLFEIVELKIDQLGWYAVELYHNFHDGRVGIYDEGGNLVAGLAEPATPQRLDTMLAPGTYRVRIADDRNGGDWRLVTTMTFLGGGS